MTILVFLKRILTQHLCFVCVHWNFEATFGVVPAKKDKKEEKKPEPEKKEKVD